MSLYNMMGGGRSPMMPMLVAILRKHGPLDPPRARDAFLERGPGDKAIDQLGLVIVVLTRTGGGNREDYQEQNDAMTLHPLYVSNEDDDFDSTYARWTFKVPEDLKPELEIIYKHMYAERDTDVKAQTDRAIRSIEGKPVNDTPGFVRNDISDADVAELKDAASRLHDKVIGA